MENYLILREKEILSFVTTWLNLKDIILSEIRHTEKGKCCMTSLIKKMNSVGHTGLYL
jgi:hypothetical protein